MKVKKFYDLDPEYKGQEIPVNADGVYEWRHKIAGIEDVVSLVDCSYENLCKLAEKGVIECREEQEITHNDMLKVAKKHNTDAGYVYVISELFDSVGANKVKSIVNDLINGE